MPHLLSIHRSLPLHRALDTADGLFVTPEARRLSPSFLLTPRARGVALNACAPLLAASINIAAAVDAFFAAPHDPPHR